MTGAALATAFAPEDIKKVVAVFAQVDNRGGGVEELAEAADLPLSAVQAMMDDAATVPRFLAAQRRAEDGGDLLKPTANRLLLAMLHKVRDELDAGTLDVDDIGNLMPKVHKVVDHAERMEQARGGGTEGLATFHITFINGAMTARVVPPAADVVDIDASEVRDE